MDQFVIDLPTTVLWLTASRVVVKDIHATGRRLFDRHLRIELDGRRPEQQRAFRFEVEGPGGSEAGGAAREQQCSCPARRYER